MRRTFILCGIVAFAVGALVGPIGAQQGDEQFIRDTAVNGVAEVAMARDAMIRGTSPRVKQLAQRLIDDHRDANVELMALAQAKGVKPSMLPKPEHKATEARLAQVSGADFDRAWADAVVQSHIKGVSAFERESREGRDPQVRQWAAKMLPTLREHLGMAQQVQAGVGGGVAPAAAVGTAPARVGTAPATAETAAWCAGASVPVRGTNFGACAGR